MYGLHTYGREVRTTCTGRSTLTVFLSTKASALWCSCINSSSLVCSNSDRLKRHGDNGYDARSLLQSVSLQQVSLFYGLLYILHQVRHSQNVVDVGVGGA